MKKFSLLLSISLSIVFLSGCGSSARKKILAGQRSLEAGNYKAAIEAFEKAARRAPNDAMLHYNLAYAYLQLGESRRALKAADDGLRIEPADARLLKLKALAAYSDNDWAAARETLDLAAQNGVPETYILNAKAAIERAKQNYGLARVHLLTALRVDPAHPAAYFNLASLYLDHFNLLPEARENFEYFKRFPQAPKAQTDKAFQFAQDIAKSLSRPAGGAINQTRNTELSKTRLAEAARFEAARNFASAQSAFVAAKNADPLYLPAKRALAEYYERRGEGRNAFLAYVEAAELPDATAEVLGKATTHALSQKRPDIAEPFCSRGMARAPSNLAFHDQMAKIRFSQKRWAEARAHAQFYIRFAQPGPYVNQLKTWVESLPK